MQDEYGRPLSDDGQWVWDGAAWQSTGAPRDPATTGYEPTQVAPIDSRPQSGTQEAYGGAPAGPQDYFAGPGQAPYPGGPVGPGGRALPPPTPWWKRPVTIIGALLVLSAVLVTILLLTGGSEKSNATPTPSVAPSITPSVAPTTDPPTPSPTTASPSPSATPRPTRTALVPDQVEPGIYDCTQGGQATGQTISFAGLSYTTNTGAVGTYSYRRATGAISFTGGDLGPFAGTYNPAGPSLDLAASSVSMHCAQ
jgi:hypothetical protein